MNAIQQRQRINQAELDNCVPPEASWHRDYADTAFIYIGGLHLDLSEGDILAIFSQFGEPVWLKLARDKDTGKSRGFAWLKYEDQRSCDLAVDNLSGAKVMDRLLNVDHTRYTPRDDERMEDYDIPIPKRPRNGEDESGGSDGEAGPLLPEEKELLELLSKEDDDDDPMKKYMIEKKRAEVEKAKKALKKRKEKEKRHKSSRSHRDDREEGRNGESRRRREREGDEDEDRVSKHRSHRSRREYSGDEDDDRQKRKGHRREDEEGREDRDRPQRQRITDADYDEEAHWRRRRDMAKDDDDEYERKDRRLREQSAGSDRGPELREDGKRVRTDGRRRARSGSVDSIMTVVF